MATKRMFSNNVIDADAFLDLPTMAQLLYFHCGMKTDDDGFVNGARKIARIIGATDDDFKLLIDSGFLIEFPESKVFVVAHHRLNNDLKNDRYHGTIYKQEFAQLILTENRMYISRTDTDCIHDVSSEGTEQNVTKPSLTKKSVTQRSEAEPSVEKESPERENNVLLLQEQGKLKGVNPSVIADLISCYGFPRVHTAFLKWRESNKLPDQLKSFIEGE